MALHQTQHWKVEVVAVDEHTVTVVHLLVAFLYCGRSVLAPEAVNFSAFSPEASSSSSTAVLERICHFSESESNKDGVDVGKAEENVARRSRYTSVLEQVLLLADQLGIITLKAQAEDAILTHILHPSNAAFWLDVADRIGMT